MKTIFSLIVIDLKLILKNIFFWVLFGVLIMIILVVNFLIPKKIPVTSPEIVTYGFEVPGYKSADTIAQLEELVKRDSIVGVIWENEAYHVLSNKLSEKQANAAILPFLASKTETTKIHISRLEGVTTPTPFNKRCLPVFICFEAVVQGFLLAGVLMLNEKSGRTIRALQVSPIHVIHYWAAKVLLFSFLGSLYSLLMALFTIGYHFPVIPFVVVSMAASALFTMLGMITAVFFHSLNNWFMFASLLLGINMLTMFAYLFPSLTFPFMKIIPSYPYIFIYEQLLFGNAALIFDLVTVMVWLLILCPASIIFTK
ncbi:MAG: type transport system permease protein, partial [Clostridiales bacterium]|nr:type transport system permease protein [Clostridiales bacterium]